VEIHSKAEGILRTSLENEHRLFAAAPDPRSFFDFVAIFGVWEFGFARETQ
jgi:hypothetical protein